MATDKPTTTGVVVDREHKDGVVQSGDKKGETWNLYRFQIAGKDGRHWYSTFSESAWKQLERGKGFKLVYSEKSNPKGGAPFRNLEYWEEVQIGPEEQEAANNQPDTNLRIAWNSAVNNAVALLAPTYDRNDSPQVLRGDVLSLAQMIYGVIAGGPQDIDARPPARHAEPPEDDPLPFEPEAPAKTVRAAPKGRDIAPETTICPIPEHNQATMLAVAGQVGRKAHPWVDPKTKIRSLCYGD